MSSLALTPLQRLLLAVVDCQVKRWGREVWERGYPGAHTNVKTFLCALTLAVYAATSPLLRSYHVVSFDLCN